MLRPLRLTECYVGFAATSLDEAPRPGLPGSGGISPSASGFTLPGRPVSRNRASRLSAPEAASAVPCATPRADAARSRAAARKDLALGVVDS